MLLPASLMPLLYQQHQEQAIDTASRAVSRKNPAITIRHPSSSFTNARILVSYLPSSSMMARVRFLSSQRCWSSRPFSSTWFLQWSWNKSEALDMMLRLMLTIAQESRYDFGEWALWFFFHRGAGQAEPCQAGDIILLCGIKVKQGP